MSDTPASWLPDPTGRHDHRYWDGTQWTDHVADAGVAGTDPYDGPAAGEEVATGAEPAATDETTTWSGDAAEAPAATDAPDGTAEATEGAAAAATGVSSGWGAPEPAAVEDPGTADEPVEEAAATSGWARPDEPAPEVTTWTSPTATGWGGTEETGEATPATGEGADDATATTAAGGWGDTTSTWSTAPPPPAEDLAAAPAPAGTVPPEERGGKGKLLLLVLALLVIVGVVVALVVTGSDDDDEDAEAIANRISSTLQDDLRMESGPADCIGEHIVDEIGAGRLQDVDFSASEAPADLEDDFNQAFEEAIRACDLSPADLGAAGGGGDDGGDGEDAADEGFEDPEQFAELLAESYRSTLGLSEEKAGCLADQMVDAVASGELTEDQAMGEFFQYLDDCQISLEELNPTTVPG